MSNFAVGTGMVPRNEIKKNKEKVWKYRFSVTVSLGN